MSIQLMMHCLMDRQLLMILEEWNLQLLTSDNHNELRGDHQVARRFPRLEPRGVSEAFNLRWFF